MNNTQNLAVAGIRYRLFVMGRSQRWLAAQLGWDISRLSRRLAGNPCFKVGELDRISAALGVDFGDLIEIPSDVPENMKNRFFASRNKTASDAA